jgi:hypothetical protein
MTYLVKFTYIRRGDIVESDVVIRADDALHAMQIAEFDLAELSAKVQSITLIP